MQGDPTGGGGGQQLPPLVHKVAVAPWEIQGPPISGQGQDRPVVLLSCPDLALVPPQGQVLQAGGMAQGVRLCSTLRI